MFSFPRLLPSLTSDEKQTQARKGSRPSFNFRSSLFLRRLESNFSLDFFLNRQEENLYASIEGFPLSAPSQNLDLPKVENDFCLSFIFAHDA